MPRLLQEHVYRLVARVHGTLSAERGQTLAEYGLIITIIAVGVTVLAVMVFRTQVTGAWNSATTCLNGGC